MTSVRCLDLRSALELYRELIIDEGKNTLSTTGGSMLNTSATRDSTSSPCVVRPSCQGYYSIDQFTEIMGLSLAETINAIVVDRKNQSKDQHQRNQGAAVCERLIPSSTTTTTSNTTSFDSKSSTRILLVLYEPAFDNTKDPHVIDGHSTDNVSVWESYGFTIAAVARHLTLLGCECTILLVDEVNDEGSHLMDSSTKSIIHNDRLKSYNTKEKQNSYGTEMTNRRCCCHATATASSYWALIERQCTQFGVKVERVLYVVEDETAFADHILAAMSESSPYDAMIVDTASRMGERYHHELRGQQQQQEVDNVDEAPPSLYPDAFRFARILGTMKNQFDRMNSNSDYSCIDIDVPWCYSCTHNNDAEIHNDNMLCAGDTATVCVNNYNFQPDVILSLVSPSQQASCYYSIQRPMHQIGKSSLWHFVVGNRFVPDALLQKYDIEIHPQALSVVSNYTILQTACTSVEITTSTRPFDHPKEPSIYNWQREYAAYLADKESSDYDETLSPSSPPEARTKNDSYSWEHDYAVYLAEKESTTMVNSVTTRAAEGRDTKLDEAMQNNPSIATTSSSWEAEYAAYLAEKGTY